MNGGDNRDRRGTLSYCPDAVGGDTTGHPLRGGVPVSTPTPASTSARLQRVSKRLGRLSPNWRNPEEFFEERSEIEHELRRLAREVEHG